MSRVFKLVGFKVSVATVITGRFENMAITVANKWLNL
jgi:hypothetical protein